VHIVAYAMTSEFSIDIEPISIGILLDSLTDFIELRAWSANRYSPEHCLSRDLTQPPDLWMNISNQNHS